MAEALAEEALGAAAEGALKTAVEVLAALEAAVEVEAEAGVEEAVDSEAAAPRAAGNTMKMRRLLKHLSTSRPATRRAFSPATLQEIETTIKTCEQRHGGEIRFAIESALHPRAVLQGLTPRQRALQLFAQLHVWDTYANNGVLIYVLHADKDVEIVADRGLNGLVTPAQWQAVCTKMEQAFKTRDYRTGCLEGIEAASRLIAQHFPTRDRNELPDGPTVI